MKTQWNVTGKTSKGDDFVEVHAHIRLNSTGETRVYVTDEILEEGELHPSTFNWAENNYSCDCNRQIFFMLSIGIELDDDDSPCTSKRYSVQLVNPVTGEIYYNEFKPEILSKLQAHQLLVDGSKITHHTFTPSEYLYYSCGSIMTEDGYNFDDEWNRRIESIWQSGWKIYKKS